MNTACAPLPGQTPARAVGWRAASGRLLCAWVGLFCSVVLLAGCGTDGGSRWLDNPLHQADQSFGFQSFNDWKHAAGPPEHGLYHGPVRPTAFGFTELLPSWNPAALTGERYLVLWVRVRDRATRAWSAWLYIGQWGNAPRADRQTAFAFGEVAIDVLELDRPADAFQLGVEAGGASGEAGLGALLNKVAVVVSGPAAQAPDRYVAALDEADRAAVAGGAWRRDLAVPFLPQRLLPEALWSRGCSPTATSMVLRYRGIANCTPARAARSVYDAEHDLYGNWGRAVAYAGSLGLDAELARFRTWDQLKAAIARGQPVIASIRFESGAFPSNPMGQTAGHLIVIRGLTESGDAIVNDSALPGEGDGIVYKADELARAWLGKGGVAYLIGGPAAR
ncbi:MAG: C39 family peptidase [Phycisphaeraceae bacterium]